MRKRLWVSILPMQVLARHLTFGGGVTAGWSVHSGTVEVAAVREASSTRQLCGVDLFIDLEILGSRLSFPNRSESNAPSFDELLCYSISYTQSLLLAARNPDHYGCLC